ncbi:sensor histidine kinase [Paenibacillaceae bacterium WGS1546]|uniref:cache domain-containing sensor histidine kinase n=1 Tax=Cohnella sp. WGS1546 TaxID=3366810 RepID=UPI00372CF6DE
MKTIKGKVWLSSSSLKFQVVAGLLSISLIVIIAVSYLAYQRSTTLISRNLNAYLGQSLMQLDEAFTTSLKQIDSMTLSILINSNVRRTLEEERSGMDIPFARKLEINTELYTGSYSANQPVSLRLFALNGGVYDSIHSSIVPYDSLEELKRNPLFDQVDRANGAIVWMYSETPITDHHSSHESSVIGIRRVNSASDGNIAGYLLISLHRWAVVRSLESAEWGSKGSMYLLDERQRVIFNSGSSRTEPLNDEKVRRLIASGTNGSTLVQVGNEKLGVVYRHSPYTGWDYVAVLPQSQFNGDLVNLQRSILGTGLLVVILAIGYSLLLSELLTKPVRQLVQGMRKVEKGNLNVQLDIRGNSEVIVLGQAFNRMVGRLKESVELLAEQRARDKEARVLALNAQFRPHFLYNTLNAIYWKCVRAGQENIAEMVVIMSRLLRYSIQPGKELATVGEDMKEIRNYLYLQKERYGDDIDIDIRVDDSLQAYRIPKLLLQPIIENAIAHGLEPYNGQKKLAVEAAPMPDGTMRLEVRDNGIGMSAERVEETLRRIRSGIESQEDVARGSSSGSTGIGMLNVGKRLRAHYGADATMSIRSAPGEGMTVTVCIPMTETEGGSDV